MAGGWRFFAIIIPTPVWVFGFDWGVAIRLYCFKVTDLNLGYFVLVKRKTCYDFDVFFGEGWLFWSGRLRVVQSNPRVVPPTRPERIVRDWTTIRFIPTIRYSNY